MPCRDLSLENLEILKKAHSKRGFEFAEGLILGKGRGKLEPHSIQGYDTSVEYGLKIISDYRGDILVEPYRNKILEPELEETESGLLYRNAKISPENPLYLVVQATSNDLNDEPVQQALGPEIVPISAPGNMDPKNPYEPSDMQLGILNELGIEPFGDFEQEKMLKILEWLRENIKYDWDYIPRETLKVRSVDKALRKGKGTCGDYSRIFADLVYAAGGTSRWRQGPVVRLIVEGTPAWKAEGENGSHAWSEVYYGNRWHVVDPTLYTTSPDFNKGRAIDGLKNIYIIPFFDQPTVFLGRNRPKKSEIMPLMLAKMEPAALKAWKKEKYPKDNRAKTELDFSSIRNTE